MRVMVIVKASRDSEAGGMPTEAELAAMGRFNEALVQAGVMLAGEGLQPSDRGARVHFSGSKRSVVDGPFPKPEGLVAGFWIWRVRSLEEAIEWARRCPFQEGELELRPVFEAEDFGEAYTPELRAQDDRLRATLSQPRA